MQSSDYATLNDALPEIEAQLQGMQEFLALIRRDNNARVAQRLFSQGEQLPD